ncbi:MAG: hypothetical protein HOP29_14235 [Phycisphaerales bacterium]|nr:hypothetical protein [Phycisphaerales bacterium]
MSFQPTPIQYEILRALEHLKIRGCPTADTKARPTPPRIGFTIGVPEALVRAWVLAREKEYAEAVRGLLSRELITQRKSKTWVTLWSSQRFLLPDGRVVVLECRPVDLGESLKSYFESARVPIRRVKARGNPRRRRVRVNLASANWIEARTPIKVSGVRREWFFHHVSMHDFGTFVSITAKGLDFLDSLGDEFQPDALVRLSQVAPLTGLSKRTLERYTIRKGFPRPDVKGGGGHASKWYWSRIRPALEPFSKKILPPTFPGSHIV